MEELNERDRRIIRAYTRPGHPTAFSAPHNVAKYHNISKTKAKKLLEYVEGYRMHREYKQPRLYNPYFVHRRREQVQADLIDIGLIHQQNDDVKFLLVIIDIFTKFVWVYPLKNKTARSVLVALQKWLRDVRVKPRKFMSDRGNEFVNASVQNLFRNNNIEFVEAYGTLKACIAERVNKTLQILIYKYLTEKETTRYINVLQKIVQTYNNRGHRTLEGMTPAEADRPRSQAQVQAIYHDRYAKLAEKRRGPKFRVGTIVRLKTMPKKIGSSGRAYAEQFHGEYFRIARINRTMPVPLYYLRSMDDGEMVKGGLYAEQLQRQRGNVYKIERVLRRRTRRGVRELLVKWKYFGPRYNEWIREDSVVQAF